MRPTRRRGVERPIVQTVRGALPILVLRLICAQNLVLVTAVLGRSVQRPIATVCKELTCGCDELLCAGGRAGERQQRRERDQIHA